MESMLFIFEKLSFIFQINLQMTKKMPQTGWGLLKWQKSAIWSKLGFTTTGGTFWLVVLKWPKSAIWSKLVFYYWWHFLVGPICATTYRHVVFQSDGILLQMALVALLALVALFGRARLFLLLLTVIFWQFSLNFPCE